MRSPVEMEAVRRLLADGTSARGVAASTGVPYSTVLRWKHGGTHAFGPEVKPSPPAPPAPWRPQDGRSYAYLLGLYLGDGCVSNTGRSFQLHIALDSGYPGIIEEAIAAVRAAVDRHPQTYRVPDANCVHVVCGWKRWPEVFPQHGPGRKHERPIVLEPWQQPIVEAHPWVFLRGLLHSDGCRTVNRFTTTLPSGRVAEYAYPRWFFSNHSADIRGLFCATCDQLGLRWSQSNHRNISISHRHSVAMLDEWIGPKS